MELHDFHPIDTDIYRTIGYVKQGSRSAVMKREA